MDKNLETARAVTKAWDIWEKLQAGDTAGYVSAEVAVTQMRRVLESVGKDVRALADPALHKTKVNVETDIKNVLKSFQERIAQSLWKMMQKGDLEMAYGSPTGMAKLVLDAVKKSGKDASILNPDKSAVEMKKAVGDLAERLTKEKFIVGSQFNNRSHLKR